MQLKVVEKLKALTRLQVLDSKLDEIHRLRGSLPEEVSDLEDDIEGLDTRKRRIEGEIKELRGQISSRDIRIQQFSDDIKRYEDQQMNVKNSREYEALRKEIEYANLEILTSQKKIRQYQEKIRQKEVQLDTTMHKIDNRMKELEDKKKELEVIIEETKIEEKKLLKEIEKASTVVEPRVLRGYRRIRRNMRNGLAVVTTDRRACGGCFSLIPPQIQIDINQQKRLIHCENCGRMLVSGSFFEEIRTELGIQ